MYIIGAHVKCTPCHINSTWHLLRLQCRWRDSLHIWRVTVNILNKQWQAADKGWSSSLGSGWGLKIPHHRNPQHYKILHGASYLTTRFEHQSEKCWKVFICFPWNIFFFNDTVSAVSYMQRLSLKDGCGMKFYSLVSNYWVVVSCNLHIIVLNHVEWFWFSSDVMFDQCEMIWWLWVNTI